ncbi:MAG: carboxypeptidase regulatory-like domain-containing protein [Acidobacteria bacterium]|nr:carboxypeptidase regulatory-like domain-containing protein [Acidobacteriota bacterium]
MNIRLFNKIVFVIALFSASILYAQDSASVTGTVRDASGASVANAKVVVSAADRGINRETTTNSDGEYSVAALPPGSYNIAVTVQGFKKFQAKDVVLRVAQKARVDVPLQVGAATTEVTVEGSSVAQVETQSSDLAGTVTGKQISELALNGRNFTQLVTLVPGVSNQTGQDEGTVGIYGNVSYSINGGRVEYNNWEIDGGDNMDNGSNSTLNVYPNADAIGEVKVLTSNYGAQYGRNASGTIEVETKSGTNKFHGTASYFGRNQLFNAYNYFDDHSAPKPSYKKHDWGYTIGGPIWKDHTYFFWSQEWRRERNPTTFLHNVPSDAGRSGDFTEFCPAPGVEFARVADDSLPEGFAVNPDCPASGAGPNNGTYNVPTFSGFANNQVTIDPVGAALLPLIPLANTDNGGFPAYQASVSTPTTWREELIKVDHNVTDKVRLTFRYIHDSWNTVTPTPLWSTGDFPTIQTNFLGPGVSLVTRLTATVSPTLLNEFVFSYTTDHITLTNSGPWQRPEGINIGLFQNGFGGKLPGFQVNGGAPYGDGFGEDPSYIPWKNSNPTYTFRDNVSKIFGKHNLQFGAYFAIGQKNEMDGFEPSNNGFITTDNTSGVTTGNAFADLLIGRVSQFQQENQQLKYYNRYKIVEPYLQDDWHITNKLTLNLGLRLSLFGTYRERYRQAYSFEPSAFNIDNAPVIDVDGEATGTPGALIPGPGNPFNGIVQCGGPGGSVDVAGFPNAASGGSSKPGCMEGHLWNPAPRIGFAWDPKGDGKMAIRGGYGIFYEHTNGNEGNSESLEGTPPLVLSPVQNNVGTYDGVGGAIQLPLAVKSIPNKAIWPYVQQWHFDIQKELPKAIVATLSYVGSKGTHLTLQRNLNQLHPVPAAQNPYNAGQAIDGSNTDCSDLNNIVVNGNIVTGQVAQNVAVAACGVSANIFRPNPGYGDITRIEDTANSNYNALQFSARRTVGALNLSVAYTYAHSIDNSSDRFDTNFFDSYDLARTRASSNFDQRHILTLSYVYDLPAFKQWGTAGSYALGGWRVSGITTIQTGTPFSVTNGTSFADAAGVGNGVGTASFADRVGDPNSGVIRNVGDAGPRLYNPAAFRCEVDPSGVIVDGSCQGPQGLTFGNSGRNSLLNPRRTNFDLSLFKLFPIHEKAAFEFRWDLFNAFNHTQFNGIDSGLGSSTFLEATSAHAARIMQFGAKFIF